MRQYKTVETSEQEVLERLAGNHLIGYTMVGDKITEFRLWDSAPKELDTKITGALGRDYVRTTGGESDDNRTT